MELISKEVVKRIIDGDIRHFYDNLKPEVVMERMRQLIKDRRTLDLIWRIVKDGADTRDGEVCGGV